MGETFAMNGGDGAYSYTKNSQYQKQASDSVKGMLQEAVIHKLDVETFSSTVVIADLGCSVGPNTFHSVQNLIEAVQKKKPKSQEFHVLFNDQSANDFNTLFASLPTDRQYYSAGVPGSFYGRLFPPSSITLAHSSFALNWLSKQPQGVPNEGRIHYRGASEDVLRAYSDQFERDMGAFIGARAEEMVRGGLVVLIMLGVPDGDSHTHLISDVLFNFLGDSLVELANEGVVEKGKIEAFNLPIYNPKVWEMRRVIEKNGCFSIEKIELTNPLLEMDANSSIMHLRASVEGIFTAHFGTCVVDKMFAKTTAKAEEISDLLEAQNLTSTQLFVVLKRK